MILTNPCRRRGREKRSSGTSRATGTPSQTPHVLHLLLSVVFFKPASFACSIAFPLASELFLFFFWLGRPITPCENLLSFSNKFAWRKGMARAYYHSSSSSVGTGFSIFFFGVTAGIAMQGIFVLWFWGAKSGGNTKGVQGKRRFFLEIDHRLWNSLHRERGGWWMEPSYEFCRTQNKKRYKGCRLQESILSQPRFLVLLSRLLDGWLAGWS